MISGDTIRRQIIDDLRVELAEEFDKNFERKAFFTEKWKARAKDYGKGSLLLVTGTMRRGLKATTTEFGVRFTSAVPYAALHNEGGTGTLTVRQHMRTSKKGKKYTVRQHTRRFSMPQRQFVGDGERTREIVRQVVKENMEHFNKELSKMIPQQ